MDVSAYFTKSLYSVESKLMEDVLVSMSFYGPETIYLEIQDQDSEAIFGINLTKCQIDELILCLQSMSSQLKG